MRISVEGIEVIVRIAVIKMLVKKVEQLTKGTSSDFTFNVVRVPSSLNFREKKVSLDGSIRPRQWSNRKVDSDSNKDYVLIDSYASTF
jgi:hypothetical protein